MPKALATLEQSTVPWIGSKNSLIWPSRWNTLTVLSRSHDYGLGCRNSLSPFSHTLRIYDGPGAQAMPPSLLIGIEILRRRFEIHKYKEKLLKMGSPLTLRASLVEMEVNWLYRKWRQRSTSPPREGPVSSLGSEAFRTEPEVSGEPLPNSYPPGFEKPTSQSKLICSIDAIFAG